MQTSVRTDFRNRKLQNVKRVCQTRNRVFKLHFLISCMEWTYFELIKRAAWDRFFEKPVILKSRTPCLT